MDNSIEWPFPESLVDYSFFPNYELRMWRIAGDVLFWIEWLDGRHQ